jgi:hypothetical protein
LKKSLLAFVIAFALAIGFTLPSFIARAYLANYIFLDQAIGYQAIAATLINTFLDFIGPVLFFVVFYFLASKNKVLAVKSTTLALLLGALLGSAIFFLISMLAYSTYIEIYLNVISGSLLSGVFYYFLPALVALLFVELREKKSNQKLIEERIGQSTTLSQTTQF